VWNGGGGYLRRGKGIRGERFESVRGECASRYGNLMITIFFEFFLFLFKNAFLPSKEAPCMEHTVAHVDNNDT
jgi:hypothetical protein